MKRKMAILAAMLASGVTAAAIAASAPQPQSPTSQTTQIVRETKGDRRAMAPNRTAEGVAVHSIEVDPRAGRIVLRDGAGRTLYVNDERQGATLVARNALLPDVTVQAAPMPAALEPHTPPAAVGPPPRTRPVELQFARQ